MRFIPVGKYLNCKVAFDNLICAVQFYRYQTIFNLVLHSKSTIINNKDNK